MTQLTSQVAPFASIRSSQTEPGLKRKSRTDDIPVTSSPPSPISPDPFPSSPFISRSRIHGAARVTGQRVPGGAPPAMEEIVATIGLGYGRGRGYRRVGAMEEVAAAATCLSRRPTPDLNSHRRRSTHAGWGSSSSSVSSWACAIGYERDCGCRRVGATEEVVAAIGLGLWKRSRLPQPASHAATLPI
jgi:hypothetical protein